jgi:hypothetical protein
MGLDSPDSGQEPVAKQLAASQGLGSITSPPSYSKLSMHHHHTTPPPKKTQGTLHVQTFQMEMLTKMLTFNYMIKFIIKIILFKNIRNLYKFCVSVTAAA